MNKATKALLLSVILGALFSTVAPVAYAGGRVGAWTGPKSGHVLYYSQYHTHSVFDIREGQGYPMTREVAGYAAVTDCSQIGRFAHFLIRGVEVILQIFDCSAPADVARHVAQGNVGEVDWYTAERLGIIGAGRTGATLFDITDTPEPSVQVSMNDGEAYLLWAINRTRAAHGLGPVTASQGATEIAHARSLDMGARDYFSHTTPDGDSFLPMLDRGDVRYRFAGEILARNNLPTLPAGPAAIQGWLDSPEHRNILLDNRFMGVGLGYAKSGDGFHYFTAVFITP